MSKPYMIRPFGDVPVLCHPFEAGHFCDSAFAAAGIACPDSIARSVRKRRAEFFHGRLCARAALAVLAAPDAQVGIGAGREPLWPAGTMGSISHTRALAAAVALPAAQGNGIGIDLELAGHGGALGAARDFIVCAAELAYLRGAAGGFDLDLLLTLVFSAKESFFKATYGAVRTHFDFDAVEVTGIDLAQGRMTLLVKIGLCAQVRAGDRHTVRFAMLENHHVLTLMSW